MTQDTNFKLVLKKGEAHLGLFLDLNISISCLLGLDDGGELAVA